MNIVMVPFHDYKKWQLEGYRTRDAHLYQHFEENDAVDKILVVNRPTSFAERLLKHTKYKSSGGTIEYIKDSVIVSKIGKKSWCIDIFLPDFMKVLLQKKMWWFTAFQYEKTIYAINEAIDYLELDDTILLLQNPMAIGTAEKVKHKVFVFDAIDNWIYHPQMKNKELIKQNYEYVDSNADLILTVSQALTKTFTSNNNTHWVPNGVDVDYFRNAIKTEHTHDSITIGYVGKIQDRVDFDLVERCLIEFPEAKFVFLGPVYSQKKTVSHLKKKYDNISFEGDIHFSALPEKMKKFDITIIPHTIDNFTSSMNPLKLYEYLAAGKLVVTTAVAGTNNISPFVYTALDHDSFIKQLHNAIEEITFSKVDVKSVVNSIPEECFWNNRVDIILDLFAKTLNNKRGDF